MWEVVLFTAVVAVAAMGNREMSPGGALDAAGSPVNNTDFLRMSEEETVYDYWNSTAEKAKVKTCEKAGGECMLKRTVKKTCIGKVDKKSKCDKRSHVCCITGCGAVYTSSSGVIRHPLSGSNYQNNEECTWIIRAQDPLRITFSSFNTEANYDFLYIRDGESIESNVIGSFNGDSIPSPVQTSSNAAHLLFTSDVRGTTTGFELYWETAEPINQCMSDGRENSALWNKIDAAINEGNNVSRGLDIRINKLETELQAIKENQQISNSKLDILLHLVTTNTLMTTEPPFTTAPFTTTVNGNTEPDTTTAPPLTTVPPTSTAPTLTTVLLTTKADTTMAPPTTKATSCRTSAPLATPGCESPWVSLNNTGCFYIYKNQRYMTWDNARSYCLNTGGDLAILECWSTRFEVYKYLISEGYRNKNIWVGGNDHSGTWAWVNNNTITDGWTPGQPDKDKRNKNCLFIKIISEYNNNMQDTHCYDHVYFNFLCEK